MQTSSPETEIQWLVKNKAKARVRVGIRFVDHTHGRTNLIIANSVKPHRSNHGLIRAILVIANRINHQR